MIEAKWTKEEEAVFAEIQAVSRLDRIGAIRLWKRCKRNGKQAVQQAKKCYAKDDPSRLAAVSRGMKSADARKRGTFRHQEALGATISARKGCGATRDKKSPAASGELF